MTDYDLRTRKALRRVVLLEYGCGPDTLRRRKICPSCGRANSADRTDCTDAGARLPEMTLYDLYRSRHRCCPGCGVAVTNVARYCPECGARLPKGTARREAAVWSLFRRREPPLPKAAVCFALPFRTRHAADWLGNLGGCRPIGRPLGRLR